MAYRDEDKRSAAAVSGETEQVDLWLKRQHGLASVGDRCEWLSQQQQLAGGRRSCGAELAEERWRRRGLQERGTATI